MASPRMVKANVSIDDEKWERLKAIAEVRRIPVAVLAREGIDRVLDLAEKQQSTIERTLAGMVQPPES